LVIRSIATDPSALYRSDPIKWTSPPDVKLSDPKRWMPIIGKKFTSGTDIFAD
jgi:hypothetical protein